MEAIGYLIIFFSWVVTNALTQRYNSLKRSIETVQGTFRLYNTLHELRSMINSLGLEVIQGLPKGSMLAVPLSEEKLKPLTGKGISIATVNSPDQCTVSGPTDEIKLFKDIMEDQGIYCNDLHTSHAFHSEMMEPILKDYAGHVKKIELKSPRIPFISNVTGTWITEQEAMDPDYWSSHIRSTVRFADGIRELLKTEDQIMLEVGPGRTLKTLAMQHSDTKTDQVILSSRISLYYSKNQTFFGQNVPFHHHFLVE